MDGTMKTNVLLVILALLVVFNCRAQELTVTAASHKANTSRTSMTTPQIPPPEILCTQDVRQDLCAEAKPSLYPVQNAFRVRITIFGHESFVKERARLLSVYDAQIKQTEKNKDASGMSFAKAMNTHAYQPLPGSDEEEVLFLLEPREIPFIKEIYIDQETFRNPIGEVKNGKILKGDYDLSEIATLASAIYYFGAGFKTGAMEQMGRDATRF